ncbi:metal-dependent hydrolase [Qingshengfaniella alkalisoli]|uniref:Metal-dependent hydrolase n=1 Tax=Qingshengfaniella alkalisoli TaxID=2599296 RepID=A0A5B8IVX6_9RHOB|nr:metal-dependent hydrolase [Qingshengfaniella alkalisoli]QDY69633.1 metal-dependent hydrolase [Qingshengfaniella alkalisoli]
MNIIWLGHSGFRIEIEDQVLLVDPWLVGNPAFPEDRRDEAINRATAILLSHGHGDHASTAIPIAKELNIPIACIHELADGFVTANGAGAIGFGKGGTISLGKVKVTMVNAVHSSSIDFEGKISPAGSEAGFMIAGEGKTIYFSGDTDITMDMQLFEELHHPDIGILCCGGHFTMDMHRAGYAAKRFFHFDTVIPCHYKTFPLLEQSAEKLREAIPEVNVIEPEVLKPIAL